VHRPQQKKKKEKRMHRKMTIVVAVVALTVALFATAAFAATIYGTSGNDQLDETMGDDDIHGWRGADTLDASLYGHDKDRLYGNRGPDKLYANDGDQSAGEFDYVNGGRGWDVCYGDPEDTFRRCQEVYTN
jgi:Ca2+-binding RTX toxin-like protein